MSVAAPIDAGRLSERITLKAKGTGQDAVGQAIESWSPIGTDPTVWASFEPLRGREFFAAGQTQSQETVLFRIRYRGDLDSSMAVECRGELYPLTAPPVNVDGRNHTLELYCTGGRPA